MGQAAALIAPPLRLSVALDRFGMFQPVALLVLGMAGTPLLLAVQAHLSVQRVGLLLATVVLAPASWMKKAAGCPGRTREQCRKESQRFNLMEADLHNLWPAIGKVNQLRSNFAFAIIPLEEWDFPGCDFEVESRKVEPRPAARGEIARSMLYMAHQYGN